MKKRIPSIVIYGLNLILLLIPWLTVGEKKHNIFQFVFRVFKEGMEQVILKTGVGYAEMAQMKLGCIFRQNSTSVPEGRHAIPLQTACLQLMFIF